MVVNGMKRRKPGRSIFMSPGRLPNHPNLPSINHITSPMDTRIEPNPTINLPKFIICQNPEYGIKTIL